MKDLFKTAVIFFGGVLVGRALQHAKESRARDIYQQQYGDLADKYNAQTQKVIHLTADVECARLINAQVMTYACNLRRALDQYEEGFE